ncbi:MAG: glycosyltransferase [Lachnospiraceae bacterium]|nr:glycosyltransferase [Lachnospiraceae bacterium]
MISVIVTCSTNDAYLTRCMNSLKRQSFKNFEVILLTDKVYDSVKELEFRTLYINEKNVCDSINAALDLVHGDAVLFCTPSSVFAPNALQTLNETFMNNPNSYINFNYYKEIEDSFESDRGNFLSIYHKVFSTKIIKEHSVQIERENVFAEEGFLSDYVSLCDNVVYVNVACVYEGADEEYEIDGRFASIEVSEWKRLTLNIQKMNEEVAALFSEDLGKKVEKCPVLSEDLVWITEENLHKYFSIQYMVARKVVAEWWYEIKEYKNTNSYEKLRCLLGKYDEEQDLQELLLNCCGMYKEQYKYIKEYDLHNALFYIEQTKDSNPETRTIEGNYDYISKKLGAIKSSQSLLEKALGVNGVSNSVEQQSILNGEQEGLVRIGAIWYYYKNGAVDLWYNGLAKNEYGWFYVRRGVLDRTYSGIASNKYGEWIIEEGTINKNANGYQKIGNREVFAVNGKIDTSKNGLISSNNTLIVYKKGEVDSSANGLIQSEGKWYYIENGFVNYSFKGLIEYGDKWWYVENGTINTAYEGYAKNIVGWYYVKAGTISEQQPEQPTAYVSQEQSVEIQTESKQELVGEELANYTIGKYASGELGLKTIFKSFGAWIKYKF